MSENLSPDFPEGSIPCDGRILSNAEYPGHYAYGMNILSTLGVSKESPFGSVTRSPFADTPPKDLLLAEHEISAWFEEGGFQSEIADANGGNFHPCPYDEGTLQRKWWTRGFAYNSRLFRAIKAESNG